MKSILLVVILAIQSFTVLAQSYLSLNVGPALPRGEYASTNLNNDVLGFADLGISASLKYTKWLENHKMGFLIDVGMMRNAFDEERYESALDGQFGSISGLSINSDAYRVTTVMPGMLIGRYDESHDSDVYAFVKLGMMSVATPSVSIASDETTETIDSQSATGFGYGAGVGAHWTLIGRLGLCGTVEYVGGTANLEGFDQPIGNLSALLGVTLHF